MISFLSIRWWAGDRGVYLAAHHRSSTAADRWRRHRPSVLSRRQPVITLRHVARRVAALGVRRSVPTGRATRRGRRRSRRLQRRGRGPLAPIGGQLAGIRVGRRGSRGTATPTLCRRVAHRRPPIAGAQTARAASMGQARCAQFVGDPEDPLVVGATGGAARRPDQLGFARDRGESPERRGHTLPVEGGDLVRWRWTAAGLLESAAAWRRRIRATSSQCLSRRAARTARSAATR